MKTVKLNSKKLTYKIGFIVSFFFNYFSFNSYLLNMHARKEEKDNLKFKSLNFLHC